MQLSGFLTRPVYSASECATIYQQMALDMEFSVDIYSVVPYTEVRLEHSTYLFPLGILTPDTYMHLRLVPTIHGTYICTWSQLFKYIKWEISYSTCQQYSLSRSIPIVQDGSNIALHPNSWDTGGLTIFHTYSSSQIAILKFLDQSHLQICQHVIILNWRTGVPHCPWTRKYFSPVPLSIVDICLTPIPKQHGFFSLCWALDKSNKA